MFEGMKIRGRKECCEAMTKKMKIQADVGPIDLH